MPPVSVEIRSEIVGGRKDEPSLGPIVLELTEGRLTVAELIRRAVEEQVRGVLAQYRLDAAKARRALDRQYLTESDVASQAASGKVRFPSQHDMRVPEIDPQAEVSRALRAFEHHTFFVLVDNTQMERPDEVVTLRSDSRVRFIRLMPLAGG